MDINSYILSKKYADNAITKELSSISAITFNNEYKSFSDLPTVGSQGVVYLIPVTAENGAKYCEEYIFTNGQYSLIGTTQINIEGQSGTIALRRDNDYNYKKIENTFIPIKGEVCFVDVAGYGLRTKVGDGISTFAQLPYIDETILQIIDSLIVKGYFYQDKFYKDIDHTILIEAIAGKVYIDTNSGKIYTYNGYNYETQNGALPNATAQIAGAMKLYNEIGQNTDGTMTQQAITNELNEKFELDVNKDEEMVIFDVDIN